MAAIELRGNRVAGNNSILARPDGSFYDFNGSVNYRNYHSLLRAHPELGSGSGAYIPPNKGQSSTHDNRSVTKAVQQMKSQFNLAPLKEYLPFFDLARIQSNVGTSYNGYLAVFMWRPVLSGSDRGSHYGIAQFRGDPRAKWMSIKGSDAKNVESQVMDDSPVYVTFGMGDFLILKSAGLNYMCFAGDGGARNSPYTNYMKNRIGSRDIRLIADNDESGKKTVGYLKKYGFKVKAFNWSYLKSEEEKMDLRDLAWQVKDHGGDLNILNEIITRGELYE